MEYLQTQIPYRSQKEKRLVSKFIEYYWKSSGSTSSLSSSVKLFPSFPIFEEFFDNKISLWWGNKNDNILVPFGQALQKLTSLQFLMCLCCQEDMKSFKYYDYNYIYQITNQKRDFYYNDPHILLNHTQCYFEIMNYYPPSTTHENKWYYDTINDIEPEYWDKFSYNDYQSIKDKYMKKHNEYYNIHPSWVINPRDQPENRHALFYYKLWVKEHLT